MTMRPILLTESMVYPIYLKCIKSVDGKYGLLTHLKCIKSVNGKYGKQIHWDT